MMKSIFLGAMTCLMLAVAGCGAPEDNSLATDGATAEDFARYEEELAAVSGGESYEDAENADDAEEPDAATE